MVFSSLQWSLLFCAVIYHSLVVYSALCLYLLAFCYLFSVVSVALHWSILVSRVLRGSPVVSAGLLLSSIVSVGLYLSLWSQVIFWCSTVVFARLHLSLLVFGDPW